MSRRVLCPLFVTVCFGAAAMAQDLGNPERGEALFGQCSGCHQIGGGAENRIGPHLNGVFGRAAAGLEDFRYSAAFRSAGATGLEWHAETLSAFLENPKSLVTGTRMTFRGIEDPGERADIIAYMRTFSASPRDIPEADPTASATDHDLDPAILAIRGDPAYGEYLSSECVTCHQTDGSNQGIPSIVAWPEEDFVVVMHAYKTKTREHPVMNMMAGRLSDEEIAALAAYFAQLE